MPYLPNPNNYTDPIKYFRDSHTLIAGQLSILDRLIKNAETNGILQSIRNDKEWADLLDFFVNVAPRHEIDEEYALFPIVLKKVQKVGFQMPASPSRFIHEQHETMQTRSIELLRIWNQTLLKNELSDDEAAIFLSNAKELISLYREHVLTENAIIYTAANDELLSPSEREEIIGKVRENHSDEVMSDYLDFDKPTFSNSAYQPIYSPSDGEDAISDDTIETDDDEESEKEDE